MNDDTGVVRVELCQNEFGTDCDLDAPAYAVRHPDYIAPFENGAYLDTDFSLIILPNPVTDIDPVALNEDPNVPANAGDELEIFGWGYTNYSSRILPDLPQIASIGYVLDVDCNKFVSSTSNQLCAIDETQATCQGDSGL